MAEVNMSLSELKDLERQIAELQLANQLLLKEQKQIVVLHKYFKATVSPKANSDIHIVGSVRDYSKDWRTGVPNVRTRAVDTHMNLFRAIQLDYVEVDLQNDNERTSKEYMNLSEVIEQVRGEESNKVRDLIDEVNDRARNAEVALETATEDAKKEIIRLKKEHLEKQTELQKEADAALDKVSESFKEQLIAKDQEYVRLLKEYDDLKSDKKRISLEDQIKYLTAQLAHEQSRTPWEKFVGSNLFVYKDGN